MKTSKSFLQTLKVIHLSFFSSQLVYLFVAYLVFNSAANRGVNVSLSQMFIPIIAITVVASYFMSNYIFKNQIKKAIANEQLSDKLKAYFSLVIIRYSFLEGASLFSTTLYLITGNFTFVYFALLVAIFFIMYNPTKEKIIFDLQLNRENQEILNNPDALI